MGVNLITRVPKSFHDELVVFLAGRMTPGRWLSLVTRDHLASGRKAKKVARPLEKKTVRILGWGIRRWWVQGAESMAEWLWWIAHEALVSKRMPVDLEPRRSHTASNQYSKVELVLKLSRGTAEKMRALCAREADVPALMRKALDRGLDEFRSLGLGAPCPESKVDMATRFFERLTDAFPAALREAQASWNASHGIAKP